MTSVMAEAAIRRHSWLMATRSLALFLAVLAGPAAAEEPIRLLDALKQGQVKASLRYRFESVSDEAFADEARASTLRLALSYETKTWNRLQAMVQFENVTDLWLGGEHVNGASAGLDSGVRGRPTIADPELTQVNQGLLRFAAKDTTLEAGRFALDLENERFVGSVGWRQNQQVLDGARIERRFGAKGKASYAFLDGVNRVFGDRKRMASHLGYASYAPRKDVRLHATLLYLDYDKAADASLSSFTAALGADGKRPLGKLTLLYDAEAGLQKDAADNPRTIDEPYLRAELGVQHGQSSVVTVRAGWELLGGNLSTGHGSLNTPLATLHRWNGWADKLLTTPQGGLQDGWAALGFSRKALKAQAVWHDYRADDGAARYGSEWDLLATYDLSWKQQLAAKAAFYRADSLAKDTTKVWLYTTWSF